MAVLPTRLTTRQRNENTRRVTGKIPASRGASVDAPEGVVAILLGSTATALLIEALAESDGLCLSVTGWGSSRVSQIVRARSWQDAAAIAARCDRCVVVAEEAVLRSGERSTDELGEDVVVVTAESVLEASCRAVHRATRGRFAKARAVTGSESRNRTLTRFFKRGLTAWGLRSASRLPA